MDEPETAGSCWVGSLGMKLEQQVHLDGALRCLAGQQQSECIVNPKLHCV
jgi:hypothetical protein